MTEQQLVCGLHVPNSDCMIVIKQVSDCRHLKDSTLWFVDPRELETHDRGMVCVFPV